ncbi:MAG: hypothetical protein ACOC28_02615 [Alkalispirochaetaceae bacterium]
MTDIPALADAAEATALFIGASAYLKAGEQMGRVQRLLPVLVFGPPQLLPEVMLLGCGDYLREPWEEGELLARFTRVVGVLSFSVRGVPMRLAGSELSSPGGTLSLPLKEARILRTLILSRGEVVDRGLLAAAAGLPGGGDEQGAVYSAGEASNRSRAVDMRVSRLRRRLCGLLGAAGGEGGVVESVYGAGYRLECG